MGLPLPDYTNPHLLPDLGWVGHDNNRRIRVWQESLSCPYGINFIIHLIRLSVISGMDHWTGAIFISFVSTSLMYKFHPLTMYVATYIHICVDLQPYQD